MFADMRNAQVSLFAMSNVFVTAGQVAGMLKSDLERAKRGLGGLVDRGMLSRRQVTSTRSVYMATAEGLAVLECPLPAPVIDPARFRRDLFVATLWVLAMRGEFGHGAEVLTRREMLASAGPDVPDFQVTHGRRFMPINVLLAPPDRTEWEVKLRRLASDPAMAVALFLIEDRVRVGDPLLAIAEQIGLRDAVRVQFVPKTWETVK